MARPSPTDYAAYYEKYVALVPEADVVSALRSEIEKTQAFLQSVPESESTVRHAPYTWSFREVVGHLIDCERVFGYRALCFARGDTNTLPGFDENAYANVAKFDRFPLAELAAEFETVRRSHLYLFGHFAEAEWARRGIANQNEISVRALAYILVGHERHHTNILHRRLAR
jgi:hypothetical protein